MRYFADLCLKPPLENREVQAKMAELAKQIGFSMIALAFQVGTSSEAISSTMSRYRDLGLDAVARLNITPRSRDELLRLLRKWRRKFEIIAVECVSPKSSLVAARDRRVDLLYFQPFESRLGFQRSIAKLCNAAFEINVSPLTRPRTSTKLAVLFKLSNEIAIAKDYGIPTVLSSGAENQFMLRSPKDLAALATMVGLDLDEALDAVSKNPISIVERNRSKLRPSHVAEGVKVMRVPKRSA